PRPVRGLLDHRHSTAAGAVDSLARHVHRDLVHARRDVYGGQQLPGLEVDDGQLAVRSGGEETVRPPVHGNAVRRGGRVGRPLLYNLVRGGIYRNDHVLAGDVLEDRVRVAVVDDILRPFRDIDRRNQLFGGTVDHPDVRAVVMAG